MDDFNYKRRQLLKGAAATITLSALGFPAMSFDTPVKEWKVALIGTGWYGKSDLFRLLQVAPVNVVALCDVDAHQLQQAGEMVSKRQKSGKVPALYANHEKMLKENKLDIVLIGSPDHWHAMHAIDAMKSGAHVYVQKPVSTDVIEGESMVAAARKYKRVVQVGTQRRSTPHLIDARKNIIEAGLLGKISHVDMCCYYHMRANGNPPVQPVPEYFDYNRWTGPAPLRPFDGMPHKRWWRAFMEYGNGIMGDMCVHMFDAVRWMLDLGWPIKISSTGGIYMDKESKSNIADTQSALFEYKDLTCSWEQRSWGTAPDPDYPWAFMIYGDKGTLKASTMQYEFIPSGKGDKIHMDVVYEKEKYPEDLTEPDIELNAAPATRRHMLNFLDAINNNKRPVADIEQGHISSASCIIANLSMKLGRPLVYDPVQRIIKNDPEATRLLRRTYRAPWQHPEPGMV